MPLFDLSLEELRTYRSASAEPEDFDAFWSRPSRKPAVTTWTPASSRSTPA